MTTSTSPIEKGAEKAKSTARAAKTRAKDAVAETREAARDAATEARARAADGADAAKDSVADAIDSTADRLDEAASNMTDDSPQANTTARVAGSVSHAAQSLRDADFATLGEDLGDLARRHPMAVAGAAAIAGFALGRFLKSSSPQRRGTRSDATPHHIPDASHRGRA
ncbi:MAG: hypothetical protein CMH66_10310 [Nioella sp.]|nr:hypothetical protein [Nioella sp.]